MQKKFITRWQMVSMLDGSAFDQSVRAQLLAGEVSLQRGGFEYIVRLEDRVRSPAPASTPGSSAPEDLGDAVIAILEAQRRGEVLPEPTPPAALPPGQDMGDAVVALLEQQRQAAYGGAR